MESWRAQAVWFPWLILIFCPVLLIVRALPPQSHSTSTLCSYTRRKIFVQRPEKLGRLLLIYRLHSQASQGLPRSTLETQKPRFRPKQSPALSSLSFLPFTSLRDFLLIHCSPVAGLQSLSSLGESLAWQSPEPMVPTPPQRPWAIKEPHTCVATRASPPLN